MKYLPVSLLLFMVGSTGAAWAHEGAGPDHGPPWIRLLREADANADGKLTQTEVKKAVHAMFCKADSDGNRSASAEELAEFFRAKRTDKIRGKFAGLDKNSDGKVTRKELGDRESHLFDRLDENTDGAVTREELESHLEKIQDRGEEKIARILPRMDRNGDSVLSESELEAGALQLFSRLDDNDNSVLEESELDRARTRRGGRHGDEAERAKGRSRR